MVTASGLKEFLEIGDYDFEIDIVMTNVSFGRDEIIKENLPVDRLPSIDMIQKTTSRQDYIRKEGDVFWVDKRYRLGLATSVRKIGTPIIDVIGYLDAPRTSFRYKMEKDAPTYDNNYYE